MEGSESKASPPPQSNTPGGPDDATEFFGAIAENTVMSLLDIETVSATAEKVVLQLPVTWKVHQPYGILHGGVSALLAESAASFGAALAAGPNKRVVGIELNASHLRAATEGLLVATATPIRIGKTVQVWDIVVSNQLDARGSGQGDSRTERQICRARCSMAVLAPKS